MQSVVALHCVEASLFQLWFSEHFSSSSLGGYFNCLCTSAPNVLANKGISSFDKVIIDFYDAHMQIEQKRK